MSVAGLAVFVAKWEAARAILSSMILSLKTSV